ncbi:hypothetical protein P8A21_41055 (plasmid) [Streptomyces poriferorum]|uniref:hypothetical protein n=1 Tax=Streptomyces poriferorum TaxID=2798799 RepID=UPI00273E0BA0|nr:hypothetical protein [Streptomyces sp. Alt1]WLQ53902.1 hypothetical protein P8A21_41055 [Streptomyces sp. Alt1]
MTRTSSRPPVRGRSLIAAAAVLAVAGCGLLALSLHEPFDSIRDMQQPASTATGRTVTAPGTPAATTPAAPAAGSTPAAVSPAPSAVPSTPVLPEPGAGPRADHLVQRALDRALPRDRAAPAEAELTALGNAVWTAEVTGARRRRWPHYFRAPDAPAAYSKVRIQASIARRDRSRSAGAVVHLVWAGADPSGTYLDGRTATVQFARQGETWTPVR